MDRSKRKDLASILADPEAFRRRWEGLCDQPARVAYRRNCFAPKVSYGRHRGPAHRSSHPAAVLMALLPVEGSHEGPFRWSIPLTLRPASMADHAGQVSFPGGKCQQGESAQHAACREYSEELGCPSDTLTLIGSLPPMYVYASRHRVVPILSIGSEAPEMNPNPDEVDQILWLPLEKLLGVESQVRTLRRNSMEFQTRGFWLEGQWVWGATAMMLDELRNRLERL